MYTFHIKDDGPDIDIIVTRAMLAIAAVACYVYRTDDLIYLNSIAALLLIVLAAFVKTILLKFNIGRLIVLSVAAIILCIATRSIIFGAILLIYGTVIKRFYKKPFIQLSRDGIVIKRLWNGPVQPWTAFNNVMLKDNLLTIDFTNNKLYQVTIEEDMDEFGEEGFNAFCSALLKNPT
ncbi:hypothetical protein BH11BAC3_BH11BAC3_17660 [soil metagenome]